ncbi:MAG TPA: ATP-dependent helicase [Oligoflexia bacterium]|nr:ATP-dependent helicase [Oligoflexia bacterium]HMR24227.1 ATP-dependent helicase [Oligoflexia bacterium]
MQSYFEKLNPEQITAVKHNYGPLLILAGAGSGKTTVLVQRTQRLILENIAAANAILVLTFTNKAARELKFRVAQKLDKKQAQQIHAGTFHSFGLNVIKKHHDALDLPKRFGVIDQSDAQSVVKELLKTSKDSEKSNFDLDTLLTCIQTLRAGKTLPSHLQEYQDMAEALYPKYLDRLKSLGVVDFEGLILGPIEIFKQKPDILNEYQTQFKQIMVDEFQDTNDIQMQMLKLLAQHHQNLTVVGDDDQSIYGWRGAQIQHILDFPKRYKNCKVVRLERNYRSKARILDLANHIIAKNSTRHGKQLLASGYDDEGHEPEVFLYLNEIDEAEGMVHQIEYFKSKGYKNEDIALLYRSNSQGGMIETALRKQQIPYVLTGGTGFFSRKEIKDILAYLKCMFRPDEISVRRAMHTPNKGIGEKTIQTIFEYAKQHKISFFKASLADIDELNEKSKQAIEHFHQSLQAYKTLLLSNEKKCEDQLVSILEKMGYKRMLLAAFKDIHTAQKRWDLVLTFCRVLGAYIHKSGHQAQSFLKFIENMDLGDVEEDEKEGSNVQLMTLHACKGLEFPVVIICGVEEGILPHQRLGQDISEERRLFYVGITRAKEHLVLTRAKERKKQGKLKPCATSRFLAEVDETLIKNYQSAFRPQGESERKAMLAALFDKIDQTTEKNSF